MRNGLLAATAAIALAAGMAPSAQATLMVSASVGAVTVLHCNDNQGSTALCPGGDQNAATGTLQLQNNTFAGITINGSVQTSTGQSGGTDILNTSNLNITNTTGTTANIIAAVGDIGFKGPATTLSLSDAGTWQQASGSTIADKFWIDTLNGQGAEDPNDHPGSLLTTFNDTAVGAADSYANNLNGNFASPATFSMTQQFTLDLVGGGQLVNSGRVQLVTPTAASEPGSLGILGASLVGLWGGIKLRRRRSVEPGDYAIA